MSVRLVVGSTRADTFTALRDGVRTTRCCRLRARRPAWGPCLYAQPWAALKETRASALSAVVRRGGETSRSVIAAAAGGVGCLRLAGASYVAIAVAVAASRRRSTVAAASRRGDLVEVS